MSVHRSKTAIRTEPTNYWNWSAVMSSVNWNMSPCSVFCFLCFAQVRKTQHDGSFVLWRLISSHWALSFDWGAQTQKGPFPTSFLSLTHSSLALLFSLFLIFHLFLSFFPLLIPHNTNTFSPTVFPLLYTIRSPSHRTSSTRLPAAQTRQRKNTESNK